MANVWWICKLWLLLGRSSGTKRKKAKQTSVSAFSMSGQWYLELVTLWGLEECPLLIGSWEAGLMKGAFLGHYLCSLLTGICGGPGRPPRGGSCPISLGYLCLSTVGTTCHSCIGMSWNDVHDAFPCTACHVAVQTRDSGATSAQYDWNHGGALKTRSERKGMLCEEYELFSPLLHKKNLEFLCTECIFPTTRAITYILLRKLLLSHESSRMWHWALEEQCGMSWEK